MEEIWKDIVGYEGIYQVSNLGRIKSLNYGRTKQEKILNAPKTGKGYPTVALCLNGAQKMYSVHRLVAEAFVPNPSKFPHVNHINEVKEDNRAENLEWCTPTYNNNHGSRTKRASISEGRPVTCVELGVIFAGARFAARQFNLSQSHITQCCQGKRKTTGGYHWKYAEG